MKKDIESIEEEYDINVSCYEEGHSPKALRDLFKDYKNIAKWAFLDTNTLMSYMLQIQNMSSLLKNNVAQSKILEMGPGGGFTAGIMRNLGFDYWTLDAQEDNNPTILCDIKDFNSEKYGNYFDMVSAFQILEHVPYAKAIEVLAEMRSASKKYVFISVPYYCKKIEIKISFPVYSTKINFPVIKWFVNKWNTGIDYFKVISNNAMRERRYRKKYIEEFPYAVHYWELGRGKHSLQSFIKDVESLGCEVVKHFPNRLYPYHYFFLFKVVKDERV